MTTEEEKSKWWAYPSLCVVIWPWMLLNLIAKPQDWNYEKYFSSWQKPILVFSLSLSFLVAGLDSEE
jgi:hypothetical protein